MNPQVGDIWEFHNEDINMHEAPLLLIEQVDDPNYPTSIVFDGLYLESGTYGVFLFNKGNFEYWKKLA